MDVHEAARQLHYSERHIKRLAKEGKLPATKVKRERVVVVEEYEFPDNLLELVQGGSHVPYLGRLGR